MTIRSALRAALAVIAVIPFAAAPHPAFAKAKKAKAEEPAPAPAKKKSVALGTIEGRKSSQVRGWVREVVQSNFELTDAEDFKVKHDDASMAKMAKDLGVEAVIIGKLEKGRLVLSVRDGATGKEIKEIELKAPIGPRLKAAVEKKLPAQLYGAFGLSTPAEEAKKKALAKQVAEEEGAEEEGATGAEEEASEEGDQSEDEGAEAGDEGDQDSSEEQSSDEGGSQEATESPLDLRAGLRFSKRDLTFNDTLSQLAPNRPVIYPLRDYHAQLDLSVFLRAELYPGAFFGAQGMGANIGIAGGFEYGIPSKTVYTPPGGTQQTLTSSVQDWYIGARWRVPVSSSFGLGFLATYGEHRYFLTGDEKSALVPDVTYKSIRVSADTRVGLGALFVEGRVGARLVLSTGELQEPKLWFEHVGGRAVEAGLTLGYQVTPAIAVIAGGEFLRYGFDFNPLPTTAQRVAGGAVDQYLGGILGARFALPGSAAVSAE